MFLRSCWMRPNFQIWAPKIPTDRSRQTTRAGHSSWTMTRVKKKDRVIKNSGRVKRNSGQTILYYAVTICRRRVGRRRRVEARGKKPTRKFKI